MSKARSARGEIVDFDLIKIKQQMASSPKTTNVKAREDFIDQKYKRRIRKLKKDVITQVKPIEVDTPIVEDNSEAQEEE